MGFKKIRFYVSNTLLNILPKFFFTYKNRRTNNDQQKRVDYYNKLSNTFVLNNPEVLLTYKKPKKHTTYYLDLMNYLKYFSSKSLFCAVFGDVTEVPNQPSFVKSRPIHGDNKNSVLLKLNKVRHFNFIKDSLSFQEKQDLLIGRSQISPRQLQRVEFYKKYFNHPLCDLGAIKSPKVPKEWKVPKTSIQEHLKYKFILSIEGYDVATNLKWIMSSNSIAVTPKLKYETWFMEGTLIPDYHFICIKDDYSDLEEKLNFYLNHPDKALQIIKNANKHVAQFKNRRNEDKISLAVIQKYFDLQET